MLKTDCPKSVSVPLRIYVAGPFRAAGAADIALNVSRASDCGYELYQRGHLPFVPHSMSESWHWKGVGDGDVFVRRFCLPWLRSCDALFLTGRWHRSEGCILERTEAQRLGMWIFASLDEVPEVEPLPERIHILKLREEMSQRCRRRLILGEIKHGDSWKAYADTWLEEASGELADVENYPFLGQVALDRRRALELGKPWPPEETSREVPAPGRSVDVRKFVRLVREQGNFDTAEAQKIYEQKVRQANVAPSAAKLGSK